MSGAIILLLATIFIIAAISKMRSRPQFSAVMGNLLPSPLVGPLSILIPLAEISLAMFLLCGIARQKAIVASMVSLVVFTIILVKMWNRGIKDCACFGESVETATTSSGIIRNLILIALAACVLQQADPISWIGPDVSS